MIKKTKINMGGGGFSHTISSTGLPTKYVEWIRGYASANITIHIDNYMVLLVFIEKPKNMHGFVKLNQFHIFLKENM